MFKKLLILFIIISGCTTNKVVKNHGISLIDEKSKKLIINQSNKNDILKIMGPPSTKSEFNENIWIYIERKISTGKIYYLGKEKLIVNDVLVLELNDMGLLASKKLYKKEDMNNLEFVENSTDPAYRKRSFVYDFLSSMRQKINDPLGKRNKK